MLTEFDSIPNFIRTIPIGAGIHSGSGARRSYGGRSPPPQLDTDPPPAVDAGANYSPNPRAYPAPEEGFLPFPLHPGAGIGLQVGFQGVVAHPAQEATRRRYQQQGDEGELPAGVGQVGRVVGDVPIRMLRLRQCRQAGERVTAEEAARGWVVPAGAQVVQAGGVLCLPGEAAVVVARPPGQQAAKGRRIKDTEGVKLAPSVLFSLRCCTLT